MDESHPEPEKTEPELIRSLLQVPADCSTERVLDDIQNLMLHHDHMTDTWQALTDLLLLSPDTPLTDVLGNVNAYIRECNYMQAQERRNLGIIQKLQRDRVEILKRFHVNQKVDAIAKIRGKARFQGAGDRYSQKVLENEEDLEIYEDVAGSESLEDTETSQWLTKSMEKVSNRRQTFPSKDLWQSSDDPVLKASQMGATSNGVHVGQMEYTNLTLLPFKNIIVMESRAQKPWINLDTKQAVHGFILPAASKSSNRDTVRHNVTPGTRESQQQIRSAKSQHKVSSATKALSASHHHTNSLKSSPGKQRSASHKQVIIKPSSAVPSQPQKREATLWTTFEVTHNGGSFEVPELGIRLSIPGGCVSKDHDSEVLSLTLHWPGDIQTLSGLKHPVGPTIDLKPNGIPLSQPLIVSIPHNIHLETENKTSTNLILLRLDPGQEVWTPVENPSDSHQWAPLGLITPESLVVHMNLTGRYALVPADKVKVIPRSLRVLGFIQYVREAINQFCLHLEIISFEDNLLSSTLCEHITDSLEQGKDQMYQIFDQSLGLTGSSPLEVSLEEVIDGWNVQGDSTKVYDPKNSDLDSVVTFDLDHSLHQLRCLLAKLVFTQKLSREKDPAQQSVGICLDLDQIKETKQGPTLSILGNSGLQKTSSGISTSTPRKSSTYRDEYFEDSEGREITKEQLRDLSQRPDKCIKVKVDSAPCTNCWIPNDIKLELVEEIKGEMPAVEKWFALLRDLEMDTFAEVLQQSPEPVFALLAYCEVTGVGVLKVKDVLEELQFGEAAKVLTRYINDNPAVLK